MPVSEKQFSGVMNLDDNNDVLPSAHHKEARNIVFRGNGNTQIAQSVVGNRLIANTLPAGTNSCIGHYYDQLNNRVFYFNYNSNGNNGIYIYNTVTKVVSRLFESGVDSIGDVLNFTITDPITSINIIYGDSYTANDTEGDVLYWVDSLGRPSKLNIGRKIAGVYNLYERSFLDVAKAPPTMPIKCAYENDNNVTSNNLRNALFQFIYRWVYDDGEKSVWSTGSEVPLPLFSENQDISADPKKNSRINVYFSTGDKTVRKIELAVRKATDGVVSDYALITSINKSTIGLFPNNVVYNYLFYNNSSLSPIDVAEQTLLQDYVPRKAKAQELLNGDTLIYGGITEGYDSIVDNSSTYSSGTINQFNKVNGLLFFAAQNGVSSYGNSSSIQIILTGAGTNDVSNIPTTVTSASGASFYINLMDAAGVTYPIWHTSTTDNINTILTNIGLLAAGYGFSTNIVGNQLVIGLAGSENWLQSSYASTSYSSTAFTSSYKTNVLYSHLNSADYKYGIVYYDSKGRTNGVVKSDGLKATTNRDGGGNNFPYVDISISSTPPDWAYYYHIVRTDNLTYGKNLQWVTNRAFYNPVIYSSSPSSSRIVYLGISNMSQYNEEIQASSGYIGYDYSAGDRVRFLERISLNGAVNSYTSGLEKDFEIIGLEANPNINGYVAVGNYIKIKYPSAFTDVNFEFFKPTDTGVVIPTILLAEDFQNYKIQIYNTKNSANGNETYFEIGEQYAVGKPTTANRYHVGQTQSQQSPQPAITRITQADNFFRYRNVPIGANYQFSAGPYTQNDGSGFAAQFSTMVINVWNSVNTPYTIDATTYEIKSQVLPVSTCSLIAAQYPNNATADYLFLNKSAAAMTLRVKGVLKASTITAKNQYVVLHAKVVDSGGAIVTTVIPRGTISTTNEEYEFPFDAKINIGVGARLFLITECSPAASNSLLVGAFNLQVSVLRNAEIRVIESSFNDVIRLELNNDSRPLIYDENAKNAFYPTLVRYSLPKNVGTLTNQTNRFFPANMDEYDRQKGPIQRFKIRGSQLRVFQSRGVGVAGVLENMIFNADGGENLIQTNKILNQIHYYQGDYGIGNLQTSLASSSNADYFVDPVRGYQVRLSQDGFTPISELYKAQYYITDLANKYTTNKNGTLGGYAKVLGTYNFFEEEYVSVFQGYTGQPNTTLAFNEYRNCYTGFYDYAPEAITSVEGSTITFRNGALYLHDNTSNYSTFYGTQYAASITFVFNEQGQMKKDFNAITLDSYPAAWTSASTSDIQTSLGQNSNLVTSDYELNEGFYHAGFMRDNNSIGGLINGDYLKGAWMQIKLSNTSNNLVYLSGLYINYTPSQRNF
jgi:hypothetical protein